MSYGLLFLFARFVLIISLPLEGLKSYGDFWNFYDIASLGTPFVNLWVEFPPLFPFISRLFYLFSGGREHAYIYLLVIFFSIVQAGSIYLFHDISKRVFKGKGSSQRILMYSAILVGLFYGWAYFDCLGVFLLLWGIREILKGRVVNAGLIIGLGGLVKWFPILIIPAVWRWLGPKKGFKVLLVALVIICLTWGGLYILAPENTMASLVSQFNKGSWETVWALLDGNLTTGNFGPQIDRRNPETAMIIQGNTPLIPSWLSLLVFGFIGFSVLLRSNITDEQKFISFACFTFVLFYLWSPGYSPQWVLFLLPLVLLSFDEVRSILLSIILLIINLLEWPLLLSRGWFHLLDEIVIGRTIIFFMLALLLLGNVIHNNAEKSEVNNAI
ncbi:MAG: hypothetical protein R3250_07895 [Melioribacteraceae bacterium]|nr:hypothetical protein [Melioribacteraceae bacterium]